MGDIQLRPDSKASKPGEIKSCDNTLNIFMRNLLSVTIPGTDKKAHNLSCPIVILSSICCPEILVPKPIFVLIIEYACQTTIDQLPNRPIHEFEIERFSCPTTSEKERNVDIYFYANSECMHFTNNSKNSYFLNLEKNSHIYNNPTYCYRSGCKTCLEPYAMDCGTCDNCRSSYSEMSYRECIYKLYEWD